MHFCRSEQCSILSVIQSLRPLLTRVFQFLFQVKYLKQMSVQLAMSVVTHLRQDDCQTTNLRIPRLGTVALTVIRASSWMRVQQSACQGSVKSCTQKKGKSEQEN